MVVFTPVNEENQRELTAVRRKTFLLAIIIGAVECWHMWFCERLSKALCWT